MTGQRYGRLVVVSRAGTSRAGATQWLCHCDCGNTKVTIRGNLVNGDTHSCGCLHSERATRLGFAKRRHGNATSAKFGGKTPEYNTWISMVNRCHNPNASGYYKYGGRGITVCDRWRWDVQAFIDDVGKRPPGTSIDRIDNSSGYEPGNVRWATPSQQALNRRGGWLFDIDGNRISLRAAAYHLAMSPATLDRYLRQALA